jgi:hypothetical protein
MLAALSTRRARRGLFLVIGVITSVLLATNSMAVWW